MKILVLVNFYYPGHRGGGPIRSVFNLTEALGDELQFYVVTNDRDFLDSKPYADTIPDGWQSVRKATVFYVSNPMLMCIRLTRLISEIKPDIIYLNSFFHRAYTIPILLARRLGLIPNIPTILAPRGELSAAALALKPLRKRWFCHFAKYLGLYTRIMWQASSDREAEEIRNCFGIVDVYTAPIIVAPDIAVEGRLDTGSRRKQDQMLKIVFLSRISRKKNLDGAIRILQSVRRPLVFDIYGPIDDVEYWRFCRSLLEELPSHITARYCGDVPNSKVSSVFADHDLLFLPTHNENYGHVIVESIMASCPILISDQTPWRGLDQKGIGKDLSLTDSLAFVEAIHDFWMMDAKEYSALRNRVREFALTIKRDGSAVQKNREMFDSALELSQT